MAVADCRSAFLGAAGSIAVIVCNGAQARQIHPLNIRQFGSARCAVHTTATIGDPGLWSPQDCTDRDSDGWGQGGGGTGNRMPAPIAGQIGNGQNFDGTNDRILASPSDSFNFASNAVSIEYWASANLTGNAMVAIGKRGSPTGYRSGIESDGRVSTLLDTVFVPSAALHHIVIT